MKLFFSFLLSSMMIASVSFAQECPSSTVTLREHMSRMGYLIDEIFAANPQEPNSPNRGVAAEKVRELRGHLVQAISFIPKRIQDITDAQEKNVMTLEFHKKGARVIYLLATLEEALEASDYHIESATREDDIRNILYEIQTLVGQAHGLFR